MHTFRTSLIKFLILISMTAHAQQSSFKEIMQIPPFAQGVWIIQGTSNDGGKTVQPVTPSVFCRVDATKVKLIDGSELVASKMLELTTAGGVFNIIAFPTTQRVWAISQPSSGAILLQIFERADLKIEVTRMVFTSAAVPQDFDSLRWSSPVGARAFDQCPRGAGMGSILCTNDRSRCFCAGNIAEGQTYCAQRGMRLPTQAELFAEGLRVGPVNFFMFVGFLSATQSPNGNYFTVTANAKTSEIQSFALPNSTGTLICISPRADK